MTEMLELEKTLDITLNIIKMVKETYSRKDVPRFLRNRSDGFLGITKKKEEEKIDISYTSSVASEISSLVAEKGFWNLDNPIKKVTSPNTHIPFAPVLEDAFIPSVEKVINAIKELQ